MMRQRRSFSTSDPTVEMQLVNPATSAANVQLSVVAELDVILTNKTGADIQLEAGLEPAMLQIFMPEAYFSSDQIGAMSISLSGWTFTYMNDLNSLNLSYAGPDQAWANGVALEFTIHNVLSTGTTGSSAVLINPANIENLDVPVQLRAPLDIVQGPSGTKPKLSDVLQASLENQGIVYVSSAADPLENALVLNLKNIGTTPIYMGKTPWTVAPEIKVRFDYGSNPGDLAPATDPTNPPVGSAWNIEGVLEGKQGKSWKIAGPGTDTTPTWVLSPSNLNIEVLGFGGSANVTFGFEHIVSITQAGHTQMNLEFSNFFKDEDTPYEEGPLSLDILKLDAPPTRGLLSLFSKNGVLFQSGGASSTTSVELVWKMLYVAKVNVMTSYPGMPVVSRIYPDAPALNKDSLPVKLPGSWNSMAVILTLQGFDAQGGYLNSLQLTVSITSNNFVDPRDSKVYRTVQVGNKYWMAHNLDYNDPNPADWNTYYDNYSSNGVRYGRLYSGYVAMENVPDGWRLPTGDDWESLVATFGGGAYDVLIDGGSSGFNAQLGGTFQSDSRGQGGKYVQMTAKGYYWTSTPSGNQLGYVLFDGSDRSISTNNTTLYNDGCYVRYVKDI